jgi:hypothetical protein
MASIRTRIKEAAIKAAKGKVSGDRKSKKRTSRGSKSGADKAKSVLKSFLK